MKTDQFDDAFRRKVEELHPPSYPEEVTRIAGYVRQNLPLGFWQKFGTGITYSIVATTVTALLSTLFYQNYVNKTLLKQVASLNQKVEKLAVAVAQKPDTVFVFKYKNEGSALKSYEFQTNNNLSENGTAALGQKSRDQKTFTQNEPLLSASSANGVVLEAGRRTIGKPLLGYNPKPTQQGFEAKVLTAENETSNVENKTSNRQINELSNSTAPKSVGQKSENRTPSFYGSKDNNFENDANQTKVVTPTQSDAAPEPVPNNAVVLAGTLSPKPLRLDSILLPAPRSLPPSAFKNFAVSSQAPIAAPRQGLKINWPEISLKNLRFRIGLGSSIARNQVGAGLLTEVLVSKRWSITTGLGAATLGRQEFDDEDQFKQRTKEDFKDRSREPQNLPPNFRIRDIRSREQLVVLPLYVNYRIPLKNDFTFMVSGGSDFNLMSSRSTSFRRQEFGPSMPRPSQDASFVQRLQNQFFNNLVLMAGLEKRWGNLSLQLNPSLKFQVKNIAFQQQSLAAGFQFRAFYRIGK